MKYITSITGIGEFVPELLNDGNLIIVFNDNAPPELKEMAVQHSITELPKEVSVGDTVILGDAEYMVTAVGPEANHTLRELGHCTLKVNGNPTVELPGEIEMISTGDVDKPNLSIGDPFEVHFQA